MDNLVLSMRRQKYVVVDRCASVAAEHRWAGLAAGCALRTVATGKHCVEPEHRIAYICATDIQLERLSALLPTFSFLSPELLER
ncbi:hypothetical protein M5G07_02950 [Serratia symbiotica]|nr:hypothetical protein [Serratia symbiotica]